MGTLAAVIALIPVLITTEAEVEQLIARLQDHGRTLAAASADRKAADDQLDADLANPPQV